MPGEAFFFLKKNNFVSFDEVEKDLLKFCFFVQNEADGSIEV
jgi:hypothetical protein